MTNEKKARDKQLVAKAEKKQKEAKENLEGEIATIKRLQNEMERERKVALEKKKQEREYYNRMLEENERNNELKRQEREKARLEDINMQKAYAAMLDKQE